AERLHSQLRDMDVIARLGGDEFAVLLEYCTGPLDAARVARRLLASLRRPLSVDGRAVPVSASIGVALDDGASTGEELLRSADTAMYEAKRGGKGGIRLFEQRMHEEVFRRLELQE